jgi:hypothetical protein
MKQCDNTIKPIIDAKLLHSECDVDSFKDIITNKNKEIDKILNDIIKKDKLIGRLLGSRKANVIEEELDNIKREYEHQIFNYKIYLNKVCLKTSRSPDFDYDNDSEKKFDIHDNIIDEFIEKSKEHLKELEEYIKRLQHKPNVCSIM